MRLLPSKIRDSSPLVWLIFLSFFLFHPILDHVSLQERLISVLGTVLFLALYFGIFWWRRPWTFVGVAAIVLLGVGFAPSNPGASVFFIYAASFLGFITEKPRSAFRLLAGLVAVVLLDAWLLHLPVQFWISGVVVSIAVGIANVHFAERLRANAQLRMAKGEVEHMAKVAERERIARDLHDVLGHTLSVIILKSELAGKLLDRDPERARKEIGDVERVSREALADVRNTIRGTRANSLATELNQAKAMLETAGVAVKSDAVEFNLTPAQEGVVALVVREAVTNIVRHAQARNCRLHLAPVNGNCLLEIQDDGRGGPQTEGNGLRGMRERIETLGGTVKRDTGSGTKLTIQFPLAESNGNCTP